VSSWQGILVPAGTPKPIVLQINKAMQKVLTSKDVQEKFAQYSAEPTPWPPEKFAQYIKDEQTRWGKVAREAGVKPE
jgi:tripartite-type tricarboxylate transporter receptor subunit TctC